MFITDTRRVYKKLPTQIIPESHQITPSVRNLTEHTVAIKVQIEGKWHQMTIISHLSICDERPNVEGVANWRRLTSNYELTERNVELVAVSSPEAIGRARLAIASIDLRSDDTETDYFAGVLD